MATLDKLWKALEALKTVLNISHSPEENIARNKEKVSMAILIADLLCSTETRSGNFSHHLSCAMETLFLMCDDQDSNVRMVADECLNRIIRTLMDGHVSKINVELHAEIKKNRNARSVRAALVKFAELAHTIRPNKRKVYIQNLAGCISNIAQRKEESVLETLASSLSKILVTLGCFMTDNDVKELLQVFLKNIASGNVVFRRTAAISILAICLNCNKSQFFIVHTINTLLESVLPVKEDQNVFTILGVLNCIRGLFGHLDGKNIGTGLRGSFGQKRKQKMESVLSVDSLIQVFELCLHWTQHDDHNIITAALETLNEILTNPPSLLLPILFTGLSRSRIHSYNPNWKLNLRTLSDISVATTVPVTEDMSLFEFEDFSLNHENLGNWFDTGSSNSSQFNTNILLEKDRPESAFQDYPDSDSVMSDEFNPLLKSLPFQASESDIYYARDSPSPPLSTFQNMAWDIGELTDGNQSPLQYTARRLVTQFLIPECGNARVSVRSLALTCLSQVLRLQPAVFFQHVDKNALSTPKGFSHVYDVICFAEDSDQQLRGHTRLLIGHLLHSLFNQALYETHFEERFEKTVSLETLINILINGIQDESSVCVRHSLSALSICLPGIMESSFYTLVAPILNKLLTVSQNPYWLVKVCLIELFCSLPFQCVHFVTGKTDYQSKVFHILIGEFLSNEDNRVRKIACEGITKIVKNLYFPVDYGTDDVVVARGIGLISNIFSDSFVRGTNKHLYATIIEENNLSRVVDILVETLMATSSKHLSYGCIEALCNLSQEYLPSLYPDSWHCRVNSTKEEPISAGGIFSLVVTLLTKSHVSLDLECHQWLLKLASNIFHGLLHYQLRGDCVQLPEKSKLMVSIDELLIHLMRLMYIFVNIVEDNVQSRNLLTSPLRRKQQQPRPNSPSKIPYIPVEKENEKDEKVRMIGFYANIPHCQKLHDIIRSGYTNYKLTLDQMASKKFLSLVRHTLSCLEVMLTPNNIIDSEKMFEELLQYLRVSFVFDSEATVTVVYQLLRSLFETDLLGVQAKNSKKNISSNELFPSGYYKTVFHIPLVQLSKMYDLPGDTDQNKGAKSNDKIKPQLQCDRAVLASRIKLFEGIVIQSLKEYTISCNVKLQAQVLRLLTLLVQLKVNYCLLDSDQIFIKFVLNQFEFLEAGQIHDAEYLIPTIFQFFVHLSNEKNHSKPVISMPKIIQLCDGLMASGQNPVTHSIPALLPVVEHIFFKSTNVSDTKDLETQKEVLLAMLLRLAEYPKVLDTIYNLLKDGKRGEDHWCKWYKQTIDAIIPLLSEGNLTVTNIYSLHLLFCLNKSFIVLKSILMLLFCPQQEGQTFTQWLGVVTVALLSLCMYREGEVLLQLEEMNLYVREEGDDPLKVNTVSKTLPPQSLLAKLLFRILSTSVLKLKSLVQCQLKDENIFGLEKTFCSFLLCCVFMLQPDNFIKVSKSMSDLLRGSKDLLDIVSAFELIAHSCQLSTLLWAHLMKVLDHSDRSSWHPFMPLNKVSDDFKPKRSLNQELIRRGTIMLYADYLAKKPNDIDSLQWFLSGYIEDIIWHCHESPVEKLLTSIYSLDLNNKILFEAISKCINKMEPVFTYRLLHTLEYIHQDYSGSVLKLVALSLIEYKIIAIARLAAAFCCRTVEYILTSENARALKEQLPEHELRSIFKSLSGDRRLFKRHSGFISLLNKFGKQCYNISLTKLDDSAEPVSAQHIRSIKLDKTWFFELVKEKCCRPSEADTHRCAYLLSKLEPNDLEPIMSSKDFNMDILKHCFSLGFSLSQQLTDETETGVEPNAAFDNTTKKILFKLLQDLYGILPTLFEAFDQKKTNQDELLKFPSSEEAIKRFYSLVPAVRNFLMKLKEHESGFENEFTTDDVVSLSRFGALCIEVINCILLQEKQTNIKHCPSTVQGLLECSACILQVDCLSASLSMDQTSSICCALLNLFKFILGEDIVLKEHTSPINDENVTTGVPMIVKTAVQMISMISLIEKKNPNIPHSIFKNARSIIISLGREVRLNWLCRIPIEAWNPPLDSYSPPTLPVELLHDTDILSKIVSRIRLLGWRGKFQFEESWVCLLGALSPNTDVDNIDQEETAAIMQVNSLAIDGITWLAISTLGNLDSVDGTKYLHIPRHDNDKLHTLKCWKRLSKMNDLICKKLKKISGSDNIYLLRVDERPNLERTKDLERYGFAQVSVAHLEAQIKCSEEESSDGDFRNVHRKYLTEYGIDIRSCIQFILDLFPQWILPSSGISLNLQFSMIKSILFISDMFTERNHFEWMLETFLELARNHPSHDEIILQYLVIGIAKCCAVLHYFEGELSDRIFKIIESALKSPFQPLAEAGLHGLLYLLQGVKKIEKSVENVELPKFRPQEFQQRVLQCSIEFINNIFDNKLDQNDPMSPLFMALVFYIMEYYPEEISDTHDLVKHLITLVKTTANNTLYQTILQGFERLVLLGDGRFNEQITRLALNMYSKSDPKITIPALQLLLACIYADSNKSPDNGDNDGQQIELMEKVTILFDRIKKGYPIEVEIICDILPGILADFFSASDILTKVIGEFLSPNQPHKGNMAAMVFQVFSQACSEQQLSLLQDWVVYSLNDLTHNIPVMMAVWSLCCFFISASINPWLKAIFPIVQSRIRQCDYEDRKILCLAAVDFYQQLNSRQQQSFVQSLKNIGSSQSSPFYDILACL